MKIYMYCEWKPEHYTDGISITIHSKNSDKNIKNEIVETLLKLCNEKITVVDERPNSASLW